MRKIGDDRRRGLTLVEVALALTLLLVIGVPVAGLYSRGQAAARNSEAQSAAVFLARELLEEIGTKAFEEPGTTGSFGRESGEGVRDRRHHDDVDDYDGYGPDDPPRDIAGAPIAGFDGFSRSVTVENVDDGDFGSVRPAGGTGAKRIVVRVASSVPGEADVHLETVVVRK